MHLTARPADRRGPRHLLLLGSIPLAAVLGALAAPAASFAAALHTAPAALWADPDSGYWIELIIVAVVTAVAGIVFNIRRKPEA